MAIHRGSDPGTGAEIGMWPLSPSRLIFTSLCSSSTLLHDVRRTITAEETENSGVRIFYVLTTPAHYLPSRSRHLEGARAHYSPRTLALA